MAPVTLEIEYGVNHMLKDPGTGNGPFLGNMTDQHHRDIVALGHGYQPGRRLADLGHTARGRGEIFRIQGLDGIDREQLRLHGRSHFKDRFNPAFRCQKDIRLPSVEPPGPHLYLLDRFFA